MSDRTQQERDEDLRQTILRANEERAAELQTLRDAEVVALRLTTRFADSGNRRLGRIATRARAADRALSALREELEAR